MVVWIKKLANAAALLAFFAVFFLGLNPENPFETTTLVLALLKGGLAAGLFWLLGIVIADIALKGIVEDIPREKIDVLEGGLVQHVYKVKKDQPVEEQGPPIRVRENAKDTEVAKHVKTV